MVMRLLDLFSGIGGFSYAAEKLVGGYETVAFCEQDEFCQQVLRKHWKDVPIYDDVRTIDATGLGNPARQSAKLDYKKQQKMIGGSGMKCLELYKIVNRDGSLEKMLSVLLTSTKGFYSNKCKLIWKKKVTPYNRLLFQLQVKMHHTDETEYGLLHTPTSTANQMSPSMKSGWEMFTPTTQEIEHPKLTLTKNNRRLSKDGKSSHSLNLADTMNLWPTPRAANPGSRPNGKGGKVLEEEVEISVGLRQRGKKLSQQMFPTPSATPRGPHTGAIKGEIAEDGKSRISANGTKWGATLETTVALMEKQKMFPTPSANEDAAGRPGGKMQKMLGNDPQVRNTGAGTLNAEWVTWLMGYPKHYLDISPKSQKTSQELPQTKKTEQKS
jgi:hypothetical protein